MPETGAIVFDFDSRKPRTDPAEPELPLQGGDGGGTFDGMEARVAKLEAHMEHVRAELARLSSVPADVATIKERLTHLATKTDVKTDIDAAVDRAGGKTQRTIGISAGLVTIAVAAINYLPRLLPGG